MSWNAVPVAILAGITGYAALLFAGLYVALATVIEPRARREYLTFALTCVAMCAYDATAAIYYDSHELDGAQVAWVHANAFSATLGAIAYAIFSWDFVKRPVPFAHRCSNALLGVLGLVVSVWDSEFTMTATRPHVRHLEVLGRSIDYYEPEPGPLYQLLLVGLTVNMTSVVVILLRYFRSPEGLSQRGQLGFLAATAVVTLATILDGLSMTGVIDWMYMGEYGITALLMAMGYVLVMRFGGLHEAFNALNGDLTRTNTELAVALEQAREGVRVKTEFLASISHELRTPLNAIINLPEGMLEELAHAPLVHCAGCGAEFELEEGERFDASAPCSDCGATRLEVQERVVYRGDADKTRAGLQTVVRAGRHLLQLVNDLLDASKLELGRSVVVLAELDPVELVQEVVESARSAGSKSGVSVRFERPANDVLPRVVLADRVRIGQVLYNLIGNAIKFSAEGAVVDVSLSAPSPSEWQLRVRDHGIGIAPEHHALIFEKFRQVDSTATRTYGGSGLGLAISKGLVELHGGSIWVESTKGEGATFFVRLPRAPSRLSQQMKPAA